jgi:predicted PolB exonuclease-like 3'-5' exonuclease
MIIAWDIETCPRPYDSLSESHAKRHKHEYEYTMRNDTEIAADDAKRKASSLHPMLGWICCISAVRWSDGEMGTPMSWTAAAQEEEKDMLEQFWSDIQVFGDRYDVQWATFDGKRFDVPFLSARSVRHGLEPTVNDILDDYPYSHSPHADLAKLWQNKYYSLEDLCDFLGVESPKDGFDGSKVAPAVEEGRIGDVQSYCESDAVATLRCALKAKTLLK